MDSLENLKARPTRSPDTALYPPVPAHVQFGGAPPKQVPVKSVPIKQPAASGSGTTPSSTTPAPTPSVAVAAKQPPATVRGPQVHVTHPVAKGNSATWSGEPKAQPVRVYPSVFPPNTVIPDVISPGVPFETTAPLYWDVSSQCRVRCPRCGLRPGHRRSHSRHPCTPCKNRQE